MKLPDYDVVVWLKSPSNPPDLLMRILEKATTDPYESTEWSGYRDLHWGFSNEVDATEFAENLLEFAVFDDVAKLTMISPSSRKVFKDTISSGSSSVAFGS